jgi:hypothetical protein
MSTSLSVEYDLHVDRQRHGRQELRAGKAPPPAPPRLPRVAKLLALAHRLAGLLRAGTFADYGAVAVAGRVTRARVSQVMALLYLAPDIQEALLFLPRVERGRDPAILADLMPIASEPDWKRQRRLFKALAVEALATAPDNAPSG